MDLDSRPRACAIAVRVARAIVIPKSECVVAVDNLRDGCESDTTIVESVPVPVAIRQE